MVYSCMTSLWSGAAGVYACQRDYEISGARRAAGLMALNIRATLALQHITFDGGTKDRPGHELRDPSVAGEHRS